MLILSEIFRKQNKMNNVVVIIKIKLGIHPILPNSKPIIVGIEIIKVDKAIKL